WSLDFTGDLPRVLRAPGSLNGKYDPPRLVTVLRSNGPRLNWSEIEEACGLGGDEDERNGIRRRSQDGRDGPAAHSERDETNTSPPQSRAPSWLVYAMNAMRVRTREVREGDRLTAVVIEDPCTACGGCEHDGVRAGTAHVALPSGRLKCKRASCEAAGE